MAAPKGAGAMRDRVKFQRRTTVVDDYGNEESTWADLSPAVERACSLEPTRGGETVIAGRLSGTALWDCWVRDDSGTRSVRVGDRAVDVRTLVAGAVVETTRVWNIRFNEDMTGKRAWRLIQMESGVAAG